MDLTKEQTPSRRLRLLLAVGALAAWFGTQALLEARGFPQGIEDGGHALLAPVTHWLAGHALATDAVLVTSSAFIDVMALFLILSGIFGKSFRPLLGLIVLFASRQACQALVALPPPPGLLWRDPGVPSLFVTYGTSTDFFFSGHTAIAVFAAIEIARFKRLWLTITASVVVVLEALTVLALQAHYTMDVVAAVFAAFAVAHLSSRIAPTVDRVLGRRRSKTGGSHATPCPADSVAVACNGLPGQHAGRRRAGAPGHRLA